MQGKIQMYVDVDIYETEYNNNYLSDDIFINPRPLQVSNVFTDNAEYRGNNNRVTVGMSFRVRCENNYYGADCDTFCEAQDNDVKGHYTCNSDGSFQCREGFEYDSGYFGSVCIDCKLGFVKEGNRCVQLLPNLPGTDNQSTVSPDVIGLMTTSGNQTVSGEAHNDNNIVD